MEKWRRAGKGNLGKMGWVLRECVSVSVWAGGAVTSRRMVELGTKSVACRFEVGWLGIQIEWGVTMAVGLGTFELTRTGLVE
jgi:hypothetical protein